MRQLVLDDDVPNEIYYTVIGNDLHIDFTQPDPKSGDHLASYRGKQGRIHGVCNGRDGGRPCKVVMVEWEGGKRVNYILRRQI